MQAVVDILHTPNTELVVRLDRASVTSCARQDSSLEKMREASVCFVPSIIRLKVGPASF
jgi:hypothetical protein